MKKKTRNGISLLLLSFGNITVFTLFWGALIADFQIIPPFSNQETAIITVFAGIIWNFLFSLLRQRRH